MIGCLYFVTFFFLYQPQEPLLDYIYNVYLYILLYDVLCYIHQQMKVRQHMHTSFHARTQEKNIKTLNHINC